MNFYLRRSIKLSQERCLTAMTGSGRIIDIILTISPHVTQAPSNETITSSQLKAKAKSNSNRPQTLQKAGRRKKKSPHATEAQEPSRGPCHCLVFMDAQTLSRVRLLNREWRSFAEHDSLWLKLAYSRWSGTHALITGNVPENFISEDNASFIWNCNCDW